MDAKEQEFLKRLQATFQIEAVEHVQAFSAGLFDLEKMPDPSSSGEIVEGIFREIHSLKGAARSVDLRDVESLCQPLESVLSALKRKELGLTPGLMDLFHLMPGALTHLISTTEAERTAEDRVQLRELRLRLNTALTGEPASAAPGVMPDPDPTSPAPAPPLVRLHSPTAVPETTLAVPTSAPHPAALTPSADLPSDVTQLKTPALRLGSEVTPVNTVRIPITKLDPLLLQAEEMIQAKLAATQRAVELREIQKMLALWKAEWAKWKGQSAGGGSMNDDAQEWVSTRLDAMIGQVAEVTHTFEQDRRTLGHMVDEHLDAMKQVLMLPVSTLAELFPRLVRDLARDQGKEVDLIIQGAEIEIDKRILEELKDPLIHLVRNSVDHGIKTAAERMRAGKEAKGTLNLSFRTVDSRYVEILLSDDGAGVNSDLVRAAAIREGLIGAETPAKMTQPEILSLIFQSGISTSKILTDISGRGLGLAIVREKVERLGGTVAVTSEQGVGTTFRLRLPLTLATFRGVLVQSRSRLFIMPTAQVERVLRLAQSEIRTVESHDTIRVDGQILPLVCLGAVLDLPLPPAKATRGGRADQAASTPLSGNDFAPVLVLAFANKRLAVQVDEVLGEEEVLVKSLGKQLSRVRNIAGATILGAGTVVPVLNVPDLIVSATRPGEAFHPTAVAEEVVVGKSHILVAEDSITSRSLLKHILETGGYLVTTAVDGVDAFTQLRSGEFDLVVSDVDMPRMSGFELTTKIRDDKRLGDMPVILVTALGSRPDRERGIDVGANAYIVKSSFDQSNLLEIIQRLL